MEIVLHWEWFKLFKKGWYTGNRIKYQPSLRENYHFLLDLGPLTISGRKTKKIKGDENVYNTSG